MIMEETSVKMIKIKFRGHFSGGFKFQYLKIDGVNFELQKLNCGFGLADSCMMHDTGKLAQLLERFITLFVCTPLFKDQVYVMPVKCLLLMAKKWCVGGERVGSPYS